MSRTVYSIRWKARGRVVSWPERPDGVPSHPAPPSFAASPCAIPTRLARSVSEFWIRQVIFPWRTAAELEEDLSSKSSLPATLSSSSPVNISKTDLHAGLLDAQSEAFIKLKNSLSRYPLANKSQSSSLNCGRTRSSGSVRNCTVGLRRGKRVA